MKTILTFFSAFVVLVAVVGCSLLESAADRPSVEFARDTVRMIAKGDFDAADARFAESTKDEHFRENLQTMSAQYLQTEPSEIGLVRFNSMGRLSVVGKPSDTRHVYVFDSVHRDKHVFTDVTVLASASTLKIVGFTTHLADTRHDVASVAWTPSHYSCVSFAIVNLGLVGIALLRWYRMRREITRPWAWLAAVMLGVGSCKFNWTTAQFDFAELARILMFSVGFSRIPNGPWILELALPLGAILLLLGIPRRAAVAPTPIASA